MQPPDRGEVGPGTFDPGEGLAGWMQQIVPYGIFTTDRELRITSWNLWLVTHSDRRTDSVIGRSLTSLYPDLIGRRLVLRYQRALEGEASLVSSALHKYVLPLPVTVTGTDLPHMLQTVRIAPLTQGGKIVGTVTMIEDVTQREVQAGVLQRQQETDRLLAAALATLLQSQNPIGEISAIFASVSPILGLDAFASYVIEAEGSRLRLTAAAGFSPKQRDELFAGPLEPEEADILRREAFAPTEILAWHAPVLRRLGLRSYCSFSLVVGERLIGFLTFGSFARATISAEDQAVLARISRYVAIALDRAARLEETVTASRAKDDFIAALSHELRTPLNPVLLVASDAATNLDYPEEAREAFRIIEKNTQLEARLIDDLLDLTRIERGKLSLALQRVDVHAVLTDALENVRPDIADHNLTLTVCLEAAVTSMEADSGRLQQVFWNVIKNAVKFTPRGGQLWVNTRTDEATGEIVIEVVDTGIGMDEKEVTRVFSAFIQGDHAGHRFGGLGLGLAISRKLVELHGGRITAASAGKQRGSTFTIALPVQNTASGTTSSESNGGGGAIGSPSKLRAKSSGSRILLVEDHAATRTTLEKILRERGFSVTAADTVQGALEQAALVEFDLVLSDIGLPDGDGYALMRQLNRTHKVRGVALSGYGMEQDLARSKDAGFFAHLTKPVNLTALDRVVDEILGTHA